MVFYRLVFCVAFFLFLCLSFSLSCNLNRLQFACWNRDCLPAMSVYIIRNTTKFIQFSSISAWSVKCQLVNTILKSTKYPTEYAEHVNILTNGKYRDEIRYDRILDGRRQMYYIKHVTFIVHSIESPNKLKTLKIERKKRATRKNKKSGKIWTHTHIHTT